MSEDQSLEGRVIRSYGNRFIVRTAEGTFDCALRGRFRLTEEKILNPIAVGDRVVISVEDPPYGVIDRLEERKNKLSRPDVLKPGWEQILVTNCDQLLVVASVTRPKLKYGTIDRFLLAGERAGLTSAVVLTKIDLADEASYARVVEVYRMAGYAVQLRTSILAGHSGVGKSTLLNVLEPGLGIRTREVSRVTAKGLHTTTHVELHPLTFGGYIADTPGIRAIGLWDVTPETLPGMYRDFRPFLGQCRVHNCLHIGEPGCRVKQAVEAGQIASERYEGYLRIRTTLDEE
jgi:ribosome biogenesis GTPase